ncbi:MAG: hypothetical protein P4M09_19190 [Devosia sp.]|nr:hypothetical protein [Devosia sp.]
MRPNPVPAVGPVPNFPRPPAAAPRPAKLSRADRERLGRLSFDELREALRALLDEAYLLRRTGIAKPIPTTTVARLNGLLAQARRMSTGLPRPAAVPALPETVILSQFELVHPLQAAVRALDLVAVHRPPYAPGWRGLPRPWRDPLAVPRGAIHVR